jgi:four helix bundle protein
MEFAISFRDLEVYKLSRQLAKEIFEESRNWPRDENFSLTSQIRRASRSVGGQIAESWGKRRYINHFISKLTDADVEQFETQHWTETAMDCNYINKPLSSDWLAKCERINRMLNKMIDKADEFCNIQEAGNKK